MKRLIPLAILATLSVASAAQAVQPQRHAHRSNVHRTVRLIRIDQPRVNHGMSPLALASADASNRADRRSDDGAILPDPDHPGWLKDKDHAGWGWSNGRAETMMGLYHRGPDPAFLRNSDLIQGGRGAAGLAVSLKLGG